MGGISPRPGRGRLGESSPAGSGLVASAELGGRFRTSFLCAESMRTQNLGQRCGGEPEFRAVRLNVDPKNRAGDLENLPDRPVGLTMAASGCCGTIPNAAGRSVPQQLTGQCRGGSVNTLRYRGARPMVLGLARWPSTRPSARTSRAANGSPQFGV